MNEPNQTAAPVHTLNLLDVAPDQRKELLRHLLLDLPTALTKHPITISSLAKSLDISRITASAFFNMTQAQFPLSLKMAVKLYLATEHYLPQIKSHIQMDPVLRNPLWIYPAGPEEWLRLDDQYRDPSTSTQIEALLVEFEPKIKVLARV
jgi:hypothetical protein